MILHDNRMVSFVLKNKTEYYFLLLSLIFLLFSGCASSGMNPSEIGTAPSIESTAPTATEPQGDPYCGLRIGMTWKEFFWSYPHNEWSGHKDYIYMVNSFGDPVIFTFDDNNQIDDIQVVPKPENPITSDTFSQIKEEMTFYEIVSLVGLPDQISGSGIERMNYYTDDGLCYYLTLRNADLTLANIGSMEYPVPSRLGEEKHCGLAVGMQGYELHYIISETQFFSFGYGIENNDFAFMRNVDGNHVIARTNDGIFTRIECYDADSLDLSPESFESIPMGVDLFTVASKVGIPHHVSYSSDRTRDLCYLASDGTKYVVEVRRVYETQGDDITDLYVVKDVRLYEEN